MAFVAGANGISGNAIIEYLIRTSPAEWSRIIITSRSPLKNFWQDPRVTFIALDFLESAEENIAKMAAHCHDVTHAFFTSYVHVDDFKKLAEYNAPLFKNFLMAIDTVAGKNLQRVCLQTGGKNYGVHLGPVAAPVREDYPRYDDKGENFYFYQEDSLFELHKQRSWSWNVIRPNAIIGFTPSKNGMSEVVTVALYLLVCKEIGDVPKFPGNKFFWNSPDDNSYAESIADMTIWAVTNEHTKNEAFNHTNGDTFIWRYFLPRLGDYFGIEIPDQTQFLELGDDQTMKNSFRMGDWAKDKKPIWEKICEKYGGNKEVFDWGTWGFFDWIGGRAWSTLSSVSKARAYGWTRYDDTYETWIKSFRMFENAGILPAADKVRNGKAVPERTNLASKKSF